MSDASLKKLVVDLVEVEGLLEDALRAVYDFQEEKKRVFALGESLTVEVDDRQS